MVQKNDRYNTEVDESLIHLITKGNTEALNTLILRHKDWIFNVALHMTGNLHEAEDVTQEILIKIITKLSSFRFKSSFKTWLYRITINHVMTMRKKGKELFFSSFESHRDVLDFLPDKECGDDFSVSRELLMEETKIECMLGMLLCLTREQRIVFILGGIFEIDSITGSEMLEISEANFRKRLSRARQELKNFMKGNCSLIDENNTCKCSRKTKAAIEKGIVDPDNLKYAERHVKKIRDMVTNSEITVKTMLELRHQEIFKDNPYMIFEMRSFDELMGNSSNYH